MGFVKKGLSKVAKFSNKVQPHSLVMGEKASAQYDLAGQLTGAHDGLYKPKEITPPDVIADSAVTSVERDRMRRMARRASGRDSTIRTGPSGVVPYSDQPKKLLGS